MRCRSCSAVGSVSRSALVSQRRSISSGVSVPIHAAASPSASGIPSSRAQISTTCPSTAGPGTAGPGTAGPGTAGPGTAGPATAGPEPNAGARSRARARKNRTASDSATGRSPFAAPRTVPAAPPGSRNPGTRQTCSPGRPSGTWLVASTRTALVCASTCSSSSRTGSAACSQVSRNSTPSRSGSAATIATRSGTFGLPRTPSAIATAAGASAGSRTVSSRTTPSTGSCDRRSSSTASRDLPMPPAPVRVSVRQPAHSGNSSLSSSDRPMNGRRSAGRSGWTARRGPAPGSAAASRSSCSSRALDRGDGIARPPSQRFTVANETPSRWASCSCESRSRSRSSRTCPMSLRSSPSMGCPRGLPPVCRRGRNRAVIATCAARRS